jgi:hypothetical protein
MELKAADRTEAPTATVITDPKAADITVTGLKDADTTEPTATVTTDRKAADTTGSTAKDTACTATRWAGSDTQRKARDCASAPGFAITSIC